MNIMNISFSEFLALMAILGSIVTVWVSTKVRIQKIETTMQLKLLELERKICESNDHHNEWVLGMKEMINQFLTDNKQEHKDIMHDVKGIRQSLNAMNIRLAEIKAFGRLARLADEPAAEQEP
ncbi:MAG: hypothetical protein ACOYNC_17475 [Bacteroidales bacterium]